MADAPLSLRCTKAGTLYVDGPLTADDWDNTALLGGARGVLVLGTDNPDRARPHAEAAVRHFFGPTATAHPCPGPTRWGLFRTSEDHDELEWRPCADAAEAAVLFTAEEVPSG